MIPPHNRDDFKQDLFIILISKGDKIIELYQRGELQYYTAGIIIRQARQQRSLYNTTYPQKNTVGMTGREPADQDYKEPPTITAEMLAEVDNHYRTDSEFPFYTKLVDALQRVKSMRELSRETGICLSTISKTMKKIRSHLKNKLYD